MRSEGTPSQPLQWRARCRACGWRDDANDKDAAARLGEAHTLTHYDLDVRDKGIDLYALPTWRRFLDCFFEVGE